MTADRFWSRVNMGGDGCWRWTGAVDTRGYGSVRIGGKLHRAHRVAYVLSFGAIPEGTGHHGTVIMHTCDDRLCCNPAHLRIGSHVANMADMKAKSRRKGIGSGADNGRAKLTPEQVTAIRQDARSQRTIAKDYGISPAQARRVRLGLQWSPN
jgi:hypothetical protein